MTKTKIVRTRRQVIEGKLLDALGDDDKAAIIVTEHDLSLIINGMTPASKLTRLQRVMRDDLIHFRNTVFGGD